MKKKHLLLLIMVISANIFAQNFQWAKSMSGVSHEGALSSTLDSSGNIYTTGFFTGTVDFDPGPGTYTISALGSQDAFILKLDASGNFMWAKDIGGNSISYCCGQSIVLDINRNIYITGFFSGTTDFNPGIGTNDLSASGAEDVFLLKLDITGSFLWAKSMSGPLKETGNAITVDNLGNIFTTGYFQGTADFDPGASSYNLSSVGKSDIFISKLDAAGNFVWAKSMGDTINDSGNSIFVDASGNIYTTGYFTGTVDFDPSAGIQSISAAGNEDVFISKLDASGNFVWAKSIGGSYNENAHSISLDASGNIFTIGEYAVSGDFDPSAAVYNLVSASSSPGISNVFISKLDGSGNFLWAKSLGGGGMIYGNALSLDVLGNVYATGSFLSTVDFDPGAGVYNLSAGSFYNAYILKLNTSGNFIWAGSMGGNSGNCYAQCLNADGLNNVYTTGYFNNTADFDPGTAVYNLSSMGYEDIFISKLESIPMDILELSENTQTTVYPNPTDKLFTIKSGLNVQLELTDQLGRVLQIINLNELNNRQVSIGTLNSGLYLITGFGKSKSFTRKIIITE